MVPTTRPMPQKLSTEDKKYLSGLFTTKDKFSLAQANSDAQGNFIIYGTSPQENLETSLSILSFLEEQKTVEYPRESIIYWTKNIELYVDESNFDKEYHYTNLDAVAALCRQRLVEDMGAGKKQATLIYMDELTRGQDLFKLETMISRYGNMAFLSIIAETLEEALSKCTAMQNAPTIAQRNVGSLSSIKNELTHTF